MADEYKAVSVIGTVVVCLSCKRVVWAYDGDYGDLRGVCNCFRLPCFRCGARGNFDGWRVTAVTQEHFGAYDAWSTMHRLTEENGYEWAPTGDNTWPCEPLVSQPSPTEDSGPSHYHIADHLPGDLA